MHVPKDESAELIDILQAAIDKGTVAGIEGDLNLFVLTLPFHRLPGTGRM